MNPVQQLRLAATEPELLKPPEQPAPPELYPLAFAQESMWFIEQVVPGTPLYNIPEAWRLRGPFDLRCLQSALDGLVQRHEVLRTAFLAQAGKPRQIILNQAKLPLEVVDLTGAPDRDKQLRGLLEERARKPFNLESAPLARVSVFRFSDTEHVLLLNLHHLISDGWSQGLFMAELAEYYASLVQGRPCSLKPLPIQYADFALWQRDLAESEAGKRHLGYWEQLFSALPEKTLLPSPRRRTARRSYRGETQFFTVPASLVDSLRDLGRQHGATLYMTLLAALNVLLQRYTRSNEIVVGSPMACRERMEAEGLLGLFVNTHPLRCDLSGEPGFTGLLQRVREVVLHAYAHQEIPAELLLNRLPVERSLAGHPLFEVVFGWQGSSGRTWKFPGIEAAPIELDTGTAKFDWTLLVTETPEGLRFRSEFNTDLFDAPAMTRLAQQYTTLLQSIAAWPERKISELPILTPGEREQLLMAGSRAGSDYERDATINELFERRAAESPDATALVFEGRAISYQELNVRANRLAHRLASRGVAQGARVGVCVPRSPEMVVAVLGTLKAGGAYVPLDPDYPAERLEFMLRDAGVKVLITRAGLQPQFDFCGKEQELLFLDSESDHGSAEESANLSAQVGPLDPAYVMYTSGSTGNPKGVLIPHRAVVRLVRQANYLEFSPGLTFLQSAPLTFDASTFEIWGALLNGARLVLLKPSMASLEELGRAIKENHVTTLWLTSGLFDQMVDGQLDSLRGLKHLLAGGDVLSPPRVAKAARELSGCQVINGYGPTENTTFTCCYHVTPDWPADKSVPIGRPVSNTQVYILDERLEPVPPGVPGELYTGGDGLGLGYVGQADTTDRKFISACFPGTHGLRLYRTGDLARWLEDGNLEFLGRIDAQAKIRGHRIEPGEVEAALAAHPQVRSVLVLVKEDSFVGKQLVAYVVPKPGEELITEQLRDFISRKLPPFLIPAHFVCLEKFPLTANGKVDRRALPNPQLVSDSSLLPPRTETEKLIAGIWCELLGQSHIGVDQDFFRLGGHSLVATQVISRLSSACGIGLPIGAIFEAPTVARLAGVVESTRNGEPAAAHAITRLGPARAAQLLERLEEFSEAEIEELLRDPEFKDVI